jgi:hypothetical protein
MKENTKLIFSVAVTALFAGFLFFMNVGAFNGPSAAPPTGSGAFSLNSNNNLSVGTSTTVSSTKLYIVASSTDSSNYALQIANPGGSLFSVRNDGVVTAGGATISAGTFNGTVGANNVSAGTLGSSVGNGNFAFPANVSTTNLSVTSLTSALILAGADGTFAQYGGASACSGGNAVTAISAVGGTTCTAFAAVGNTNAWTATQTFEAPIVSTGTLDTVTALKCGTSPSITGSNGIGRVTAGTNASSTCSITFGTAFINKPVCTISTETSGVLVSTLSITPSVTTLVITEASSTVMKSAVFDYICIGQ